MEYGELIRAHRSQRVDVILNMDFDPEAVDACDSEPIYRDRLYVVAGKKHRLASCSEGVLVEALSGETLMLPDEQSYPGLAYRYGEIVRNASDVNVVGRYHDIDTLYLRVARGDCIGFSSGHNFHLFEGRAAFVPLCDIDTTYTVSAQWLKRADPAIGEVAREAARVSSAYMKGWSDGIAST